MSQDTTLPPSEKEDEPDIYYSDDKRTIRISMDKGEWIIILIIVATISIGGMSSWVL